VCLQIFSALQRQRGMSKRFVFVRGGINYLCAQCKYDLVVYRGVNMMGSVNYTGVCVIFVGFCKFCIFVLSLQMYCKCRSATSPCKFWQHHEVTMCQIC